jgi:hypothetical protein
MAGKKPKKRRSRFWVVTTHALTAGFAMPVLAIILGDLLAATLQLPFLQALLTTSALQALGYIVGTFHSLAYLRKTTIVEKPTKCIVPSVVAFAVFGSFPSTIAVPILCLKPSLFALVYADIQLGLFLIFVIVFSHATKHAFRAMEAQQEAEP